MKRGKIRAAKWMEVSVGVKGNPAAGAAADLQTVHLMNPDPGCEDYSSPLTRPEGWKQAEEEEVQLVSTTHTRT